jgi:hypothetical protein
MIGIWLKKGLEGRAVAQEPAGGNFWGNRHAASAVFPGILAGKIHRTPFAYI